MSKSIITAGGGTGNITTSFIAPTDADGKAGDLWIDVTKGNIYCKVALSEIYQKLDFLQSNGSQYIDTGVKPTGDTRVTMTFQFTSHGDPNALFGARNGTTSNNFNLWVTSTLFGPQYYNNDWTSNQKKVSIGTNIINVDWNKNICTINNVSASFTKRTFTCSCNLFLYALDENGSVDGRNAIGKMFDCSIYNNDILLRNYIPVKRKSDNVVGWYDLVNNTLYERKGSGSFTSGPVSSDQSILNNYVSWKKIV